MKPVSVKNVFCVSDAGASLGEGPLWDPRDAALYWVDIKGEKLFRYHPASNKSTTVPTGRMITAIGLHNDGGFIAAGSSGFLRLMIVGQDIQYTEITNPEASVFGNRFNDGGVDHDGRFWAGTMDDAEEKTSGSWWRHSPSGRTVDVADGFMVTNGPAFDIERKRIFLTDSARQTVFVSEASVDGPLDLKPFLQFTDGQGYPDGMELDAEGGLWIAFWDGWEVRRFSPDGDLLQSVELPVPRPTSVTIVDSVLYVTSARFGLKPGDLTEAPLSGGLFRIELDRQIGLPPRYFG